MPFRRLRVLHDYALVSILRHTPIYPLRFPLIQVYRVSATFSRYPINHRTVMSSEDVYGKV